MKIQTNRGNALIQNIRCKNQRISERLTLCWYQQRYVMVAVMAVALLGMIFWPSDVFANNLETQLDGINTIITDKVKKYGISIATIAGGIWALFKGNIKLMGVIIVIGITLAYFLRWVDGGMVLS